ncbi:phosphorylase [Stenomitos frigidus]|uniref:Phosphorylase n=1 Tax=Stenomitos frigidus ULC18 TaxID=2107698 RepID=A0A2T1ED46_9CYAN|nr:phosphorylase [Stenomitos frigidus]PSB30677.1 phosphorylase [Stenomitos frigidus ULC18]
MIDLILVPQGAEYQAVRRGIRGATAPIVVPIPVGPAPLSRFLQALQQRQPMVPGQALLVMGLCGGLTQHQAIGDIVFYRECINRAEPPTLLPCDAALTERLQSTLIQKARLVRALTSDRLVSSAQEKHQLAQQYSADVVDMEGFAALESLQQAGVTVAMLRVISDNAQHALPTLTNAISADGALRPLPLALGMMRQPIAAARLVRGSLKGLKTLQAVTKQLCSGKSP